MLLSEECSPGTTYIQDMVPSLARKISIHLSYIHIPLSKTKIISN